MTQHSLSLVSLDDITLAKARRGDRAALTALINHHGQAVYALVGRMMVKSPQYVEDLSQDILVKVIRGLPRFDPRGPAKLSTWILTIATRTCIDALRQEKPTTPLPEPETLTGRSRNPEQKAADRELMLKVQHWMGQLPADQRAVLILRSFHDFDYPEIAQALGIEEGTVKSRLGRARETLRRNLQEMDPHALVLERTEMQERS